MRENHDKFEFPFSYKIIMILLKLEINLMKILLFYSHKQKKRGNLWQNSFNHIGNWRFVIKHEKISRNTIYGFI